MRFFADGHVLYTFIIYYDTEHTLRELHSFRPSKRLIERDIEKIIFRGVFCRPRNGIFF